MQNLKVSCSFVDDSDMPFEFYNGRELIQKFLSDDWAAPPKCLRIEAESQDGRRVIISIPYSDSDKVSVNIEENDRG